MVALNSQQGKEAFGKQFILVVRKQSLTPLGNLKDQLQITVKVVVMKMSQYMARCEDMTVRQ